MLKATVSVGTHPPAQQTSSHHGAFLWTPNETRTGTHAAQSSMRLLSEVRRQRLRGPLFQQARCSVPARLLRTPVATRFAGGATGDLFRRTRQPVRPVPPVPQTARSWCSGSSSVPARHEAFCPSCGNERSSSNVPGYAMMLSLSSTCSKSQQGSHPMSVLEEYPRIPYPFYPPTTRRARSGRRLEVPFAFCSASRIARVLPVPPVPARNGIETARQAPGVHWFAVRCSFYYRLFLTRRSSSTRNTCRNAWRVEYGTGTPSYGTLSTEVWRARNG